MEMPHLPHFKLPNDPDRRMAVAAMLTCAICNMNCGPDEAVKRGKKLNEGLLKSAIQKEDKAMATGSALSDDYTDWSSGM